MTTSQIQLIYTTLPVKKAEKWLYKLLQESAVKCVNVMGSSALGFSTLYKSKLDNGNVEIIKDNECMVWLKCHINEVGKVVEWIENNHPYEIPCIIQMGSKIANKAYSQWIND